jgi:hypothetical protein
VSQLRSFGRFWWNFIVGDDWRVAVGVAVALGVTYLLTHNGVDVWWLLPAAIALVLAGSLWRAVRPRGQDQSSPRRSMSEARRGLGWLSTRGRTAAVHGDDPSE